MANIFNTVSLKRPKRSKFDLTHDVKMSMDMGYLTPCCILETVPGDKFQITNETLVRFAPLVSPVMHRMDVTIHYWYVPRRLVWPRWGEWIFDQDAGNIHPTLDVSQAMWDLAPIFDYIGIPRPESDVRIDPTVLAAYQMVYNEYYRDQNLIPEVNFQLVDGTGNNGNADLYTLRKRAWEHDYFTSALPFAQKGQSVAIPIGTITLKDPTLAGQDSQIIRDISGNPVLNSTGLTTNPSGELLAPPSGIAFLDPNGSLEVEATSITSVRRAHRLQEWLERNARAGTRLFEGILSHFGIKSQDARLQRPEYITGVKSPVQISEVLNTAGVVAEGQLPQGNMSGHGISVAAGNYGNFFSPEHGIIIGIMSVMSKTAYQDGLPRMYTKYRDQFLHFWPTFENIGEQEVENQEVYMAAANREGVFGYVPRYAEYKFLQSRVAGDFRNSLSHWHMGRIFGSEPALNQTFIEADPTTRIFAVQDGVQPIYVHCLNKIRAIRPMQYYSDPTI